ncbi:iron-sulfur cluster assembly accessory protein [Anaeromyxobacter sp. K]|uniref:Iron-sulfur cluster assembly accessory protein n=1 Tax=Anaeromyxobacter dehalogenans (strain ATCC BAA-258 / DSM 21875 / 2CP-1) TaxID=455488 RepID=B8JC55_ANAD2|nr:MULTISPECIES: iron-sulfur cluster assembly accessory protein [Anaeromyxobacter]ACG71868.1 iron-sulfur cluster assembly accessory protein [Anaeromyxobacter sp. K]ACL63977.1 iron-sulfur cluster assembly accessory protein [Anaeromyxobacter dehalogenans 2CP-1]
MAAAIEISEKAAVQIKALGAQKGTPAGGLRLGVKGGGCSGLSYFIDWSNEPARFDQVIERDGARVFVDPKSAVFLAGTVIDWQQTLMQTGFVFRNPNVKSACGCGESFTI